MNPTFSINNQTIVAVSGGESAGGANTLSYTVVNNDEPNVSFTRSLSQFMSAPTTTFNIQTNGGFTAVVRVRFMDTLFNERIFDFKLTGGTDAITLSRNSFGTRFDAWIMNVAAFTATLTGGTIVQNQWTNMVMRYTLATNLFELYQDGVLVAFQTVPSPLTDRTLNLNYIGINGITNSLNTFGNLVSANKWRGIARAPNGLIYCTPFSINTVLEIDPVSQTTSTFGNVSGTAQFIGAVLATNGKIYGIPFTSSVVLEIDPVARTTRTFGNLVGSGKWEEGVLASNGKIYGVPYNSTNVLEINPATDGIRQFGPLSADSGKWAGGALAPNGKIYCIPLNASTVLEIDPTTDGLVLFGSLGVGGAKWRGGVLASNGKIYGVPYNSSTVLEIDPTTLTTRTFGNLPGANKWNGGVLAPNGKIYCIPADSATVLEIDPATDGLVLFGSLGVDSVKWQLGALAPNGKIYGCPYNALTVLEITPTLTSSIDYAGMFVYDRALSNSEIATCLDYIQGRQLYTPDLITIDSSNNITSILFYFTPGGDVGFPSSISGVLPLGTYTPQDLATALTIASGTGTYTEAFWTWDSSTQRFTVTVNPASVNQYMELRNDFGSTWLTTLGFVPSTVPYQTSYTAPNAPPALSKFALIARNLGLADNAKVSAWGEGVQFTQPTLAYQPVFWRRFNNWVGLGTNMFSLTCNDIAYARNRWVATGSGTNTLAYSNDGINWNSLGTGIFISSGNGVMSSDRMWVAGGNGVNSLAYSSDGIFWTGLGNTLFEICYETAWNAVLNRWVAVGNANSAVQNNCIAYSSDGVSWTIVASSPFTGTAGSSAYCVSTAILANGATHWVAGGQNNSPLNNTLAYSTDGITWTGAGNSIFSEYCFGVEWNGRLWVAVGRGSNNSIATSTDGINWTGRGTPAGVFIGRRVAWTDTYWIVAGEPASGGNCLAISYDGVNWTGITHRGLFTTRALSVGSNGAILDPLNAGFLLDAFPGAAAAYSLRQLRTGVTNVIRVRRSSDNTEADFTASEVIDGTLVAWVGAGNGFVRTWYDQTGNARDLLQPTNANQLTIVTSGTLVTDTALPALQSPFGFYPTMTANWGIAPINPQLFLVSRVTQLYTLTPRTGHWVDIGNQPTFANHSLPETYQDYFNVARPLYGLPSITLGTRCLESFRYSGGTGSIFINGALVGSNTFSLATPVSLLIGGSTSGYPATGFIQELIIYSNGADVNSAAIEANINSYYGILDSDALAYIAAVEAADGQPLERGVRDAIYNFVVGCKIDRIWNAIKASCILAGARTLAGALVPLKGTAPTNFNFVAGDYIRQGGLQGDGSTKYLDSNRSNNADPQNSNHNAVYVTALPMAGTNTVYMGTAPSINGRNTILPARSVGTIGFANRITNVSNDTPGFSSDSLGLIGHSRASSTVYTARAGGSNATVSSTSSVAVSTNVFVFSYQSISYTDARMSFYSIGEAIDLARLDARVTTLMTTLGSVLPDPDALAYIAAVEAADGQRLEQGVRDAINAFVLGCKTDGIWNAIQASCILAGARTLAGALVPLKGTAPTNFNFLAKDYDRTTGLVGDGSTKYLDSNRAGNVQSITNIHASIYANTVSTTASAEFGLNDPTSGICDFRIINRTSINTLFRCNDEVDYTSPNPATTGFVGSSRSGSANYTARHAGGNVTVVQASSATASSLDYFVFAQNTGSAANFSDARLSFYSIGEALDLARLDARVTTLMTTLGSVLPDPDAIAYIATVEAIDGQPLEQGVRDAINAFIVGCKADGIWNAIQASCILAGARTLAGALVPLKGVPPTNFNFVAGDYTRQGGLKGNGSTKYLDSNRNNNADPQNSKHMAFFVRSPPTITSALIGAREGVGLETGSSQIINTTPTGSNFSINSINGASPSSTIGVGLSGASRTASNSTNWRLSSTSTGTDTATSETPFAINIHVFQRSGSAGNIPTDARMSFYSIGGALNLARLDARVTTLMNSFLTVIPDPDAIAYITAVQAADGQPLEQGVSEAIYNFIVGCKADGIWDAIRASCILAGARTLAGALVPLKGTAPTNFNFVAGDYNRKTGLLGNGSTKRLDSNRAGNADPQNSKHFAMFIGEIGLKTGFSNTMCDGENGNETVCQLAITPVGSQVGTRVNNFTQNSSVLYSGVGFYGVSRNNSATYLVRGSATDSTITVASQTPNTANAGVFMRTKNAGAGPTQFFDGRLSFYSIGEALDLARFDARTTTLMTRLGFAIP